MSAPPIKKPPGDKPGGSKRSHKTEKLGSALLDSSSRKGKPSARVHYEGGRVVAYAPDTEAGRALFRAAAKLIDTARVP